MRSISVIIPVYNRAPLIGATLLSLLNQTYPAVEIILVDDGSTDGSTDVARVVYEDWKKYKSNVRGNPNLVILSQENSGPGAARNLGFSHARGNYIHFFDSDDLASENKHEVQLRALEKDNSDIVFSPWVKFRSSGNQSKLIDYVIQQNLPDKHLPLICWWLRGWSTVMQSMLFRKSFLKEIGPFRGDMPSHQDSEYMTRVLLADPKVSFAPEGLTLYRVHDFGNITPLVSERKLGRLIDRARFLMLAELEVRNHGLELDFITRNTFYNSIYREYTQFKKADYSVDNKLYIQIHELMQRWSALNYKVSSMINRVSTRVRFGISGTRYMTAMKAAKPTPSQEKVAVENFYKYHSGEKSCKGISIIIPAYNRALLIGETLRSLLNQTIPAEEIIVVDDGSTDDTSNAAYAAFEEWKCGNAKGKKVPEFKVIRQENAGPAAARNAGFAASNGDFIHFFDSDDLAVHNKHEVQLRALFDSGADIAYGPWVKGEIGHGKIKPENHVLQQRGLPQSDLIKALLENWSIVPHACLFRRSIVEKAGSFPENLFGTEDQQMFLNCLLAGARVVHSPGTLELYRSGDSSQITAVGDAQKRLALNWSRFLINADVSCRKHGKKSRKWFGFRCRAWEAKRNLKSYGIENPDVINGLEDILVDAPPDSIFQTFKALRRIYLGLKFRISGGRAHSFFRSGPLTKEQKILIEKMGLKLTIK